jgi:hypothetical protein
MRDSVTRARNTEVQSNLTSEILLDSTQGLTLNVNSTPYSCFTPYYVSIHTPVTTFSESQGGVTPLNLDAEATRAKTRFWNRIAETFYQLHERTYHLYTASAYMASPDEELALLEAVRVVNVDGQRALREFMIFLRNTRDEGELLMSRCAREHMEQLQEFDRFCQRREVLVNTMKWYVDAFSFNETESKILSDS